MTRWRSCSRSGLAIRRRNWGWPTRKLWNGAEWPTWMLESMRSSSSALSDKLSFVDDEQRAAALAMRGFEEILQTQQHAALIGGQVAQSQRGCHHPQQVVSRQHRRDDMCGDNFVRIDLGDEALDERGLSCADVARDDDEAFAALQTIGQMRHSLGVNAALA